MAATHPSLQQIDPDRPFAWFLPLAALSIVLHGALLWYVANTPPPVHVPMNKPVELVMVEVEVEPPKPPEPPKVEEPPPPQPKPVKPPPVKVARADPPKEIPKDPPPPPPPNDTPPAETPKKPVPLVVGISMSSTTTAGSFAAAVGNTVYGKTDTTAKDPNEVKAYAAEKYAPIHAVDSAPVRLSEPKVDYPDEARRADVEGAVVLKITISPEGNVTAAKLISGPGYGLNEAALAAIRKFKFKPAIKGGEPVGTEMTYTYTFLLD